VSFQENRDQNHGYKGLRFECGRGLQSESISQLYYPSLVERLVFIKPRKDIHPIHRYYGASP
jgi:hypothetical protein